MLKNIFTPVCHSVHRGVWLGALVLAGSGPRGSGLRGSPIFRGVSNFLGGLQFFMGVLHFFGGSPIFWGSPIFGRSPIFWEGLHRNMVNVWPVHILLECILVFVIKFSENVWGKLNCLCRDFLLCTEVGTSKFTL